MHVYTLKLLKKRLPKQPLLAFNKQSYSSVYWLSPSSRSNPKINSK